MPDYATKRIVGERSLRDELSTRVSVVPVDGLPHPLRATAVAERHSPTGFEWGYGGSGPAALAHSILIECGVPEEVADRLYQRFKAKVVAGLPPTSWGMLDCDVRDWVRRELADEAQQ